MTVTTVDRPSVSRGSELSCLAFSFLFPLIQHLGWTQITPSLDGTSKPERAERHQWRGARHYGHYVLDAIMDICRIEVVGEGGHVEVVCVG